MVRGEEEKEADYSLLLAIITSGGRNGQVSCRLWKRSLMILCLLVTCSDSLHHWLSYCWLSAAKDTDLAGPGHCLLSFIQLARGDAGRWLKVVTMLFPTLWDSTVCSQLASTGHHPLQSHTPAPVCSSTWPWVVSFFMQMSSCQSEDANYSKDMDIKTQVTWGSQPATGGTQR